MLHLDYVAVWELVGPIFEVHRVFFLLNLEVVVLRDLAHLFFKRTDNFLTARDFDTSLFQFIDKLLSNVLTGNLKLFQSVRDGIAFENWNLSLIHI